MSTQETTRKKKKKKKLIGESGKEGEDFQK